LLGKAIEKVNPIKDLDNSRRHNPVMVDRRPAWLRCRRRFDISGVKTMAYL